MPQWATAWSLVSTRSGSCLECWYSWHFVGTGCPHCYTHQYLHRGKRQRENEWASFTGSITVQSEHEVSHGQRDRKKHNGSNLALARIRQSLAGSGWLKVQADGSHSEPMYLSLQGRNSCQEKYCSINSLDCLSVSMCVCIWKCMHMTGQLLVWFSAEMLGKYSLAISIHCIRNK